MFSYWEQESFSFYDHIVIGAGITGLNTAISLKERFPAQRVLVLERGLLTTGASSRNAGFACYGSATEIMDDLQTMTPQAVLALCTLRKKGLDRLRKRLGDKNIRYRENGSYELIREAELPVMEQLVTLNELLEPLTGKPAYRIADDKIESFGFSGKEVKHLLENIGEGELHTGKMLRALTDCAIAHGVEIKTGASVTAFEETAAHVTVDVKDPFRTTHWKLGCATLCICTNAFTKTLLPDVALMPGRGQVLITEPLRELKFRGIFHFDKGYYYFREIDGRVLLGGGRNLDFNKEATTDFALNETIQQQLEYWLRNLILPGQPFRIAQRWTGIMAFGTDKQPILRAFSPKVFGAFRMGGMGVAMASEIAAQLAAMIQEQQ